MRRIARIVLILTAVLYGVFGGIGRPLYAQNFLRDAETENFLREITYEMLEVAGIDPASIIFLLIGDKSMNAAAGGRYIMVTSGMILSNDDVNQLLGVLAHEAGHIAGGHSVRRGEAARPATAVALLGLLLGVAAVVAGAPDAGAAVLMGSQSSAQRMFLRYSRAQESAADQAAVRFLEGIETSGIGLVQQFEKFRDQEYLLRVNQDPYIRTHPLSSQRVATLRDQVARSVYYEKPPRPDWQQKFLRIKAKLAGYLQEPRITFLQYPESDTSMIARYARIYAYNQDIRWEKALDEGLSLIAEYPNDPYFQEIVGQIYLENGMVAKSLPFYRRADTLLPHEPLILTSLGHALVALDGPDTDQEAIKVLELAAALDIENDMAWRQLAVAYARADREPEANHATAEMFLIHGRLMDAAMHAQRSLQALPRGSPKWLRSQDILILAQNELDRNGRRSRRRR